MNRYKIQIINKKTHAVSQREIIAEDMGEAKLKAIEYGESVFGWGTGNVAIHKARCEGAVFDELQLDEPKHVGKTTDEWQRDIYVALLCGILASSLIGLGILACVALLTMKHLGAY